jgi:hypothetical protein
MLTFNDIKFPNIKGLSLINQLMDNSNYKYLALIQYEDIIDYYLLTDLKGDTLKQLGYYLYIAYDIRQFTLDNIKVLRLESNQDINNRIINTMNSDSRLQNYYDLM